MQTLLLIFLLAFIVSLTLSLIVKSATLSRLTLWISGGVFALGLAVLIL